MQIQSQSHPIAPSYLHFAYKCFCGKKFISKSLMYTHCAIKHDLSFSLDDNSIFSKHLIENQMTHQLRQKYCTKRVQVTEPQVLIKRQETKEQHKYCESQSANFMANYMAKIQNKPCQQNVSKAQVQEIQKSMKTFAFLKEYLDAVSRYDTNSYFQTKVIINLLIEFIYIRRKNFKPNNQLFKNDLKNRMAQGIAFQIQQMPSIFNIFVSEYLPQILFQRGSRKSDLLRSTKFKYRNKQVNFIGHLHRWLKLNNYVTSELIFRRETKQLLS